MYGLIVTTTGWTWEYVDEFMTLPRLNELRQYWEKEPPVHVSVAAYFLGKTEDSASPQDPGNLNDLMQMIPERVPHGR